MKFIINGKESQKALKFIFDVYDYDLSDMTNKELVGTYENKQEDRDLQKACLHLLMARAEDKQSRPPRTVLEMKRILDLEESINKGYNTMRITLHEDTTINGNFLEKGTIIDIIPKNKKDVDVSYIKSVVHEDIKIPNTDLVLEKGDRVYAVSSKKAKEDKDNCLILSENLNIDGRLFLKGTAVEVVEAKQYTFGFGEPTIVTPKYKSILSFEQEELLRYLLKDMDVPSAIRELPEKRVEDFVAKFKNLGIINPTEKDMRKFVEDAEKKYEQALNDILENLEKEEQTMREYYIGDDGYGDSAYILARSDYDDATLPEWIEKSIKVSKAHKSEIIDEFYQTFTIEYSFSDAYRVPFAEDSDNYIYYGDLGYIEETEIQFNEDLSDKLEKLTKDELEYIKRNSDVYIRNTMYGSISIGGTPFWYTKIDTEVEKEMIQILTRMGVTLLDKNDF